jgi:hypothetical protein
VSQTEAPEQAARVVERCHLRGGLEAIEERLLYSSCPPGYDLTRDYSPTDPGA